mmetsp:Transcript_46000/g.103416  ORF Transcript_46000/g.103416 Transcript_46000/m.103416 type:complete len:238 (+) Transcript_46000:287-1000(+)
MPRVDLGRCPAELLNLEEFLVLFLEESGLLRRRGVAARGRREGNLPDLCPHLLLDLVEVGIEPAELLLRLIREAVRDDLVDRRGRPHLPPVGEAWHHVRRYGISIALPGRTVAAARRLITSRCPAAAKEVVLPPEVLEVLRVDDLLARGLLVVINEVGRCVLRASARIVAHPPHGDLSGTLQVLISRSAIGEFVFRQVVAGWPCPPDLVPLEERVLGAWSHSAHCRACRPERSKLAG